MTGILLSHERYVPPLASNFSTLIGTNSVSPTITDSAPNSGTTGEGTVFSFGDSVASGDNIRAALKAISVGSGTIIARIKNLPISWEYTTSGLCISDGTKLILFGYGWGRGAASGLTGSEAGPVMAIENWTSSTGSVTSPSGAGSSTLMLNGPVEWYKITFSGNQPTGFYISNDGVNWVQLYGSNSGFLSSIAYAGFAIHINNFASAPAQGSTFGFLNCMYYSDPDITPSV